MVDLDRKKILIIDDDEVVNHINLYLIKALNYFESMESKTASVVALDYIMDLIELREDLPGIILIDICMPMIDGFQFLKLLKELFEENNITDMPDIIVLSSQELKDFERFSSLHFVKQCLTKPLDVKLFNNTLKRLGYTPLF